MKGNDKGCRPRVRPQRLVRRELRSEAGPRQVTGQNLWLSLRLEERKLMNKSIILNRCGVRILATVVIMLFIKVPNSPNQI